MLKYSTYLFDNEAVWKNIFRRPQYYPADAGRLTVNADAFCGVLFVQSFLQRVAGCFAVAHFFHAQRWNAAAASFDGAFGENIADRHAEDDEEEEAEGEE